MSDGVWYKIWRDLDPNKDTFDKLVGVVRGYEEKYDATPTSILVNPADFEKLPEIEDVDVQPRPYVAPSHFYLSAE